MKKSLSLVLVIAFALPSLGLAAKGDLKLMQTARIQFGKGQSKKAIETYAKIQKGSEYWLEALEEQAHAYGRSGQYDKALANLKTVLAPQFTGLIGPEPYFVAALTELRICDYTAALKTTKEFKKEFKTRILNLESVNSKMPELMTVYQRAQKDKKLNFEQLGHIAPKLPRMLYRDKISISRSQKSFSSFAKIAEQLAKMELNEINNIISKMQIIESEVIQKVNLLTHAKNRQKQGNFARQKNELVFPGDDEIWFDELGQFKAEIEKCPTTQQRASL